MRVNRPTKIITHHAVSLKTHTAQDVDNWHRDRWPGFVSRAGYHVGYHYVIEWDGTIVQCREHDEEGAHTIGQNLSSIGVCFMGNFDQYMPSKAQESSWRGLYAKIGGQLPTYPHRKYANKSCHGRLLSDDHFAKLVDREYLLTQIEQLKMLINRLQALLTLRRQK